MRRTTGRAEERGASAVEFALVVPLLVTMVFGIITFGYMLSFRQAVSQAAAEGARAAAVAPATADRNARATEAINDSLSSYDVVCAGGGLTHDGSPAGTCSISAPAACTTGADGECVVVTLDYLYSAEPLLPAPLVGLILPDNLRYVTEVRVS
ncbi:pilus assembly protein [Nocardioides panacisoli]|uniref:TadE family protein n=1 Tax=Nocardioides panacisoli TaxID=627624 RepID=UPI001C637D46|nr:TadE family protein [Nocardioides panacisoli]QYJ04713.1 pilus assembly protein [Nocardioides panacisoli]